MARAARFHVDPRLAALLGAAYRSSEQAIQELVDNSWDADADNIWITLPEVITGDEVLVEDDGSGMTEQEVRSEYLKIARDRRQTKGDRTPRKNRPVKGRKGVGKFAGLMMASVMRLYTRARGNATTLTIRKEDLRSGAELEALSLPIDVEKCDPAAHGTAIQLSKLEQHWNHPSPDRLRAIPALEYGREEGFQIYVNGAALSIDDVPGVPAVENRDLPIVGSVQLRLRITEDQQPARQAGVVLRVGGKIVGPPSFFGLDEADDVPLKLLRRVYGEVEADGLSEDVSGSGFHVIENSKGYAEVQDFVQEVVRKHLNETCSREMNLAKARLQQEINKSLEKVPEYRREFARRAIERIMQRFYDEPEERIRPIISVVLEALEHDEYWQVIDQIDRAKHEHVTAFAEALHTFGLLELSMIAQQAKRRLTVLEQIDELIRDSTTHELAVHRALGTNLWIFGSDFALMSSNQTLASVLERYTGTKFSGERSAKRPDLLLLSRFDEKYLLVEFKRPNHRITRNDVAQAEQYRDDLIGQFSPMAVFIIGGSCDAQISGSVAPNVSIASYGSVINRARQELSWLLRQLGSPADIEAAVSV